MKEKPNIKLELTIIDKTFEVLGWTSILAIWVLTIINYKNLPETIPIHFNIEGKPDSFGRKGTILILPLIATILFIAMTILNKFPHLFNYPTPITPKNAFQQYTNATRLIRFLKLIIVFVFGLIEFQTFRIVNGQSSELGVWFLPLTLGLIFIPITIYLITSFKPKQKG